IHLCLLPVFLCPPLILSFFYYNATARSMIYTLSLHDALPISNFCSTSSSVRIVVSKYSSKKATPTPTIAPSTIAIVLGAMVGVRSEEHTSELQSRFDLVCRLLLEKKKSTTNKRSRPLLRSRAT